MKNVICIIFLLSYTNALISAKPKKMPTTLAELAQTDTDQALEDQPKIPNNKVKKNSDTNTQKTNPDDDDGTAYRVLQQFAGTVLQFSRIVAEPHNPTTIKSALCAILAHWIQIFAEITRTESSYFTDQTEKLAHFTDNKTLCSRLDLDKVTEINDFIANLDQKTKDQLLAMVLYIHATDIAL